MAEKMTMAQAVRAGAAFNPLSSPDGQGEVYEGNAQTLLSKAMADHGWLDMRFVTEHQVNAAGWRLNPGAEKVQITVKDDHGTWGNRVLYNAEQISGMPSVAAMLTVAETRIRDAREEAALPFMVVSGSKTLLYSADGKSALASDYTGIVEGGNPKKFWYVSQDKGVRSIEPLDAATYADAKTLIAMRRELQEKMTAEEDKAKALDIDKNDELEGEDLEVVPARRVREQEEDKSEEQSRADEDDALAVTPVFRERQILKEPQFLYAEAELLGRVFKERVPGSGEYVRGEEKKVAFIDKGASLVVRDKQPDCYKAVMELAKHKGWTAIELTGKKEHLAKGWLEAQLLGIEVTNYTPGEQDLAALDARRAEMERKAIAEAQEALTQKAPEGAEVVSTGRFIGRVVDVKGGYAVQESAPGVFVAHDLRRFESAPEVDKPLDVQYSREGKAIIKGRAELAKGQEQDGGRSRGIGGR